MAVNAWALQECELVLGRESCLFVFFYFHSHRNWHSLMEQVIG